MSTRNKERYIQKVNSLFDGRKDKQYEQKELYGIDYPRIAQFENNDIGCFFLSPLGTEDTVELKKLNIYDTNKGYGTKLLGLLCNNADTYKITLLVWPLPEGKKPIPLDKLKSWYSRFGFEEDEGTFMKRKPKEKLISI